MQNTVPNGHFAGVSHDHQEVFNDPVEPREENLQLRSYNSVENNQEVQLADESDLPDNDETSNCDWFLLSLVLILVIFFIYILYSDISKIANDQKENFERHKEDYSTALEETNELDWVINFFIDQIWSLFDFALDLFFI